MDSARPPPDDGAVPDEPPVQESTPETSHDLEDRDPAPGAGRLTRSRDDRVLWGVAGGLGEYFGIDPVVFRIGFVALTLLGGAGLLLYVLAWLVIPEEGGRRSIGQHLLRRGASATAVGMALLVLAAVVLLHDAFHWSPRFGGSFLAVTFLVLGLALLWRRPEGRADAAAEHDAPETPPVAEATPEPTPALLPKSPEAVAPPPPPSPPEAPAPPAPPPRPRRPRSRLGRGTVGVLLVMGGVLGLLEAAGAVDVFGRGVFTSLALVVVGAGLVVGGWWGRARWLIAVGLALTAVLAFLSAFDIPLRGGFGERLVQPTDLAELDDEYHLFAGEIHLDLGDLDFAAGTTTDVQVTVVFGELHVVAPDDARTIVDADIDLGGEIRLPERNEQGFDVEARDVLPGRPGGGTVRLHLKVGAGEIEVRRGTS